MDSESKIQQEVFLYFWNNHHQTRGLIFHVPNEVERIKGESIQAHVKRIGKLKSQGLVPGVPDLIILPPFKNAEGIELKTSIGVLSKEQVNVHRVWIGSGYSVKTFYSSTEAITHIKKQFGL